MLGKTQKEQESQIAYEHKSQEQPTNCKTASQQTAEHEYQPFKTYKSMETINLSIKQLRLFMLSSTTIAIGDCSISREIIYVIDRME